MNTRILVIAPHADDEVLGCGGVMHKYQVQGHEVYVLIVTNASVGAPELYDQACIDNIRNEALLAHGVLGVTKTFFLELPAPRLDTFPVYQLSNKISEVLKEIQPNTLFIPHRGDIHKDHMAVFNASMVAARPINNCSIKRILSYETLSETEWAPPFRDDHFKPNVFISIEGSLNPKIEAIKKFKSQLKDFPHPRSVKIIRSLAELRGSIVGFKAAEAFMLIRDILE